MVTIATECQSKLSLVSPSDDLTIGTKRICVQPTGKLFKFCLEDHFFKFKRSKRLDQRRREQLNAASEVGQMYFGPSISGFIRLEQNTIQFQHFHC